MFYIYFRNIKYFYKKLVLTVFRKSVLNHCLLKKEGSMIFFLKERSIIRKERVTKKI